MARRRLRAASRLNLPPGLEDVPEPVARHFVNLGGFEIALFLRRLTPSPGRVLVVGVGAGRDYYYLGLRNEVIALDLVAQSTVPSAILADFSDQIPLPARSVDAVVISDVLEHVFDDRRALLNCRTVLKDDGCLVLNVPYGDDIGDHHVRVYTRRTLHRLLRASGFHIVEEVERGPLAHLDRYWLWRAVYHGTHFARLLLSGDPRYDRTLRWLTAVDWWFGQRRLSPGRYSRRHGAYIKAVKADPRDFTQLNRELYADQGARQLSRP